MVKIITWIFRVAFLFLLYYFLLKTVLFMIKDLRRTSSEDPVSRLKPDTPQPAKAPAELVVLESVDNPLVKGEVFPIRGKVTMGRASQNQIQLKDNFTSQDHAMIYQQDGHFWIRDLDSLNGTFINGQRIFEPIILSKGDQVKIGGVTFQFVRWDYEVQ